VSSKAKVNQTGGKTHPGYDVTVVRLKDGATADTWRGILPDSLDLAILNGSALGRVVYVRSFDPSQPPAAKAGAQWAGRATSKKIYNALQKTGKADFGDGWFSMMGDSNFFHGAYFNMKTGVAIELKYDDDGEKVAIDPATGQSIDFAAVRFLACYATDVNAFEQ